MSRDRQLDFASSFDFIDVHSSLTLNLSHLFRFLSLTDGTAASDVSDLTYEEVTRRMLRLLYVSHQSRWIDGSLRTLMGDWLRRVEERFAGIDMVSLPSKSKSKLSFIQSYSSLDENPQQLIDDFFVEYPAAKESLLAAEDVAYFLAICQRPGQKPVPFIPILDESFQTCEYSRIWTFMLVCFERDKMEHVN